MIYLASPYSNPDPDVMQDRYIEALRCTAQFLDDGVTLYSPIVHSHNLKHLIQKDDWEFWKKHDAHMISICTRMYVLTLDGWKESIGVSWEIEFARLLDKHVAFIYWNKALQRFTV